VLKKICRNAALVWTLAILLISAAWAAPESDSSSLLVNSPKRDRDVSLEHDIGGSVTVTCEGVFLKEGVVYVEYSVLSEEDIVVKVSEAMPLFDGRGGKLDVPRNGSYVSIGEEEINEREVIAGVKTAIVVKYPASVKYKLTDTYARTSIVINGQNLVFREIPGKK
jgi:hypothetical protein